MTVPYFLDTNILLYAASKKKEDAKKRKIASELIESGEFGLSAQVLAEFYNSATRKMQMPMTEEEAEIWIDLLLQQHCLAIDPTVVKSGIRIARRYRISYWDGAIVAAAEALGAQTLYTEDLSHGQSYGAVTAVNPFVEAPLRSGFHDNAQAPLAKD